MRLSELITILVKVMALHGDGDVMVFKGAGETRQSVEYRIYGASFIQQGTQANPDPHTIIV